MRRLFIVALALAACGPRPRLSDIDLLIRQQQYTEAWRLAEQLPATTNEGIFSRLKVVSSAGCKASPAIRRTNLPALEAHFNARSSEGWNLLRSRLMTGDDSDRYVVWKILRHVIGDPFARQRIVADGDLKRSLIARLASIHDCPSSKTTPCKNSAGDFDVSEGFSATLGSATILAAYADRESYAVIADLSRCPDIFPWLIEAGVFSHMGSDEQFALVSRLSKYQHSVAHVDAILDVLSAQGDARGAGFLDSLKLQDPDTAQKCRRTAEAIRNRPPADVRR